MRRIRLIQIDTDMSDTLQRGVVALERRYGAWQDLNATR